MLPACPPVGVAPQRGGVRSSAASSPSSTKRLRVRSAVAVPICKACGNVLISGLAVGVEQDVGPSQFASRDGSFLRQSQQVRPFSSALSFTRYLLAIGPSRLRGNRPGEEAVYQIRCGEPLAWDHLCGARECECGADGGCLGADHGGGRDHRPPRTGQSGTNHTAGDRGGWDHRADDL